MESLLPLLDLLPLRLLFATPLRPSPCSSRCDWHLTPPPGIGKSLAWKLASQGLNVVVVALDDQLLTDAVDELKSAFPECKFARVITNGPCDCLMGRPAGLDVMDLILTGWRQSWSARLSGCHQEGHCRPSGLSGFLQCWFHGHWLLQQDVSSSLPLTLPFILSLSLPPPPSPIVLLPSPHTLLLTSPDRLLSLPDPLRNRWRTWSATQQAPSRSPTTLFPAWYCRAPASFLPFLGEPLTPSRSLQVEQKLRGCFVYTSSAAAMMPSPFTVLYAATKSFISSFAASLAAEVKHHGIDVCVIHPSPVATRFYDNQKQIDLLDFFKVTGNPLPNTLPPSLSFRMSLNFHPAPSSSFA